MSSPPLSTTPSDDFRLALNAVRGLASLWVVIYHFRHVSDYPWGDVFAVGVGYLGVDIFFALSGLVICHVYLKPAVQHYGVAEHMAFLWLRIARLWPVHAALMVALLVAALLHEPNLSAAALYDWVALTLLVHQWFMPDHYVWNDPAWSISAEFFAYTIVFPAVVWVARRYGLRPSAGAMLALAIVLYVMLESSAGTVNETNNEGPIIRVVAGFSLGVGLYCLTHAIRPSRHWDLVALLGMGCFAISLFGESDLSSIAAACVVLIGLYLGNGRTARFFSAKPWYWLGEWSFSLYLVHKPVLRLGKFIAEPLGFDTGPVFCVLMLLLSVASAAALYHYLETPARRYLRDVPIQKAMPAVLKAQ